VADFRDSRGRLSYIPLPSLLFRQKPVVREGLANHPNDDFLALEIGLGNRVDGAFHGNLMGFGVILAHHRACGQGGLPPDLGDFIRHGFDSLPSRQV
jgi:hypothetical protein